MALTSSKSPFCIVRLHDETAARTLISRSILGKAIYELWGQGRTYQELHADVRRRTEARWPLYKSISFKFAVDSYAGKRSAKEKAELIRSFSYLDFQGPIKMADPEEEFCIFEEHCREAAESTHFSMASLGREPKQLFFGRWIARGNREAMDKYDLKKRHYISTTSMDAELSLISANISLAAPGKMFYDPFVGTGSFCVAMAHFGAGALGSDIDGRSFRGKDRAKGRPIGLVANLEQYGLQQHFLDAFVSDLTNSPIRSGRGLFDGIICDPPYGVREGLKVLGSRDGKRREEVIVDGIAAH
jgi:tRNA (guanine10-N2)-methyltransferase